jgi:arginine decarboxylase-like protein
MVDTVDAEIGAVAVAPADQPGGRVKLIGRLSTRPTRPAHLPGLVRQAGVVNGRVEAEQDALALSHPVTVPSSPFA